MLAGSSSAPRENAPVPGAATRRSRSRRAHAARVVAITAVAIALYQPLGFVITMALLLFTLTFGAERRPVLAAAAFSAGVVALTYLLFAVVLKTPLEPGILGF